LTEDCTHSPSVRNIQKQTVILTASFQVYLGLLLYNKCLLRNI